MDLLDSFNTGLVVRCYTSFRGQAGLFRQAFSRYKDQANHPGAVQPDNITTILLLTASFVLPIHPVELSSDTKGELRP